MQHVPYNQSGFFAHQQHSAQNESQSTRMPQYNNLQPSMSNHHAQMLAANHVQGFSDAMQQDPLGRFQGLDIGSRGSHPVKPEGPSISASESSSTF